MQTKPNQFLINEGALVGGEACTCAPRGNSWRAVSQSGISVIKALWFPACTWAGTISAGRPGRLTVCYSWGCPSSAPARTDPSPRSSVPGTTSLPLQREKPNVRNALWKRLPHHALLPHQLSWEQEVPPAAQGEAKDEDEEMPRALQNRMGVRAADSSSILGKAKGTRLRSQEVPGQPTQRLPQQGSVCLAPPRDTETLPHSRDHHSS